MREVWQQHARWGLEWEKKCGRSMQEWCKECGSSVKEMGKDGTRALQGLWKIHAMGARSVQGVQQKHARSVHEWCKKCARGEFTELMAQG